ncbi:T9SS type A sorting domain-containing protein [candidate division WOR-3 bacterium]|nr:T9SS type A sorting domain-containing protein [candidate division WOR-3 bacterium]
MKKYLFLLIILFPLICFGFSNLMINNSTTPTFYVNETLSISGVFEADTSADIKFYTDVDRNNILDNTDKLAHFVKIFDGSPFDADEVQNNIYMGLLTPIPVCGKGFFVAIDNGGADTIPFTSLQLNTTTNVSGQVIVPDSTPGIITMIRYGYQSEVGIASDTDSSGYYSINIPDSLVGQYIYIGIMDLANVAPGYVCPYDSILITTGSNVHNIAMIGTDGAVLQGNITDNFGTPILDTFSLSLYGSFYIGTTQYPMNLICGIGSNGSYSMDIMKGSAWSYWTFLYNTVSECLYPLCTERKDTNLIISGPVTNMNVVVYKTDSDINGHVYIDGIGTDAFMVKCDAITNENVGEMYTLTYSDGHYSLPISTASDSYGVYIEVPTGYTCDPSYIEAAYGDTGINFYINPLGIKEIKHLNKAKYDIIYKNGKLFINTDNESSVNINLIGVDGRTVYSKNNILLKNGSNSLTINIRSGLYFVEIKNSESRFVKKIIKL